DDLIGVNNEVFEQYGQFAYGTGLAQVVVGTLEILDIGQDRQAGRPVGGVAGGNLSRVEVGTDHTLGRGGLFDFSNNGRLALSDLVFNGAGKAAQVVPVLRFAQQIGLAAQLAGGDDFSSFGVEDLGQNVVHGFNFLV